jgi:hypothetical protein
VLRGRGGVMGAEAVELPALKGYDSSVRAWRLSLR